MSKLVLVSHAYLPQSSPRAVQLGRLVQHMSHPSTVYCSTNHAGAQEVQESAAATWMGKILGRIAPDVLNRPDKFQWWAFRAAAEIEKNEGLGPEDTLVTFSQPHSVHMAGLGIKKKTGAKWAAFFSDPFTDNPFYKYGALGFNKNLEREIFETADMLLFTSQETIDLVTAKYPADIRKKCRVLEHSYSEKHGQIKNVTKNEKTVIRHLGNLYGERSPLSLLKVLQDVRPEGACFDFVGKLQMRAETEEILQGLPKGLVSFSEPVEYERSLELMHEADILLLIEAPFENSPFLPSKLVEYIGAGKPILALTPEGTGARVAREAGAIVADIRDEGAVKEALSRINEAKSPSKAMQERFSPQKVASLFETYLGEL